jgi:hypothetical protein
MTPYEPLRNTSQYTDPYIHAHYRGIHYIISYLASSARLAKQVRGKQLQQHSRIITQPALALSRPLQTI